MEVCKKLGGPEPEPDTPARVMEEGCVSEVAEEAVQWGVCAV